MSKLKFGNHLKELRIHLCQNGASSKGAREFIETNYVTIKSNNPSTPILVRECSRIEPRLWARFEKGKETSISLAKLEAKDILCKLEGLVK